MNGPLYTWSQFAKASTASPFDDTSTGSLKVVRLRMVHGAITAPVANNATSSRSSRLDHARFRIINVIGTVRNTTSVIASPRVSAASAIEPPSNTALR